MGKRSTYKELEQTVIDLKKEAAHYKSVEATQEETENRYRVLFNNTSDAIFIHEMGQRFIDVNPAACNRYGYSKEEFLKMSPREIFTEEYHRSLSDQIDRLHDHGCFITKTNHVRRDGSTIPTQMISQFIQHSGKKAVLTIARDKTEHRRSEADISEREQAVLELRESEERFRLAVEATRDGLWENSFDHKTDFFSDRMLTMLGYEPMDPKEAFGFFCTLMHPDDVENWDKGYNKLNNPGCDNYTGEFRLKAKDGTWRHILSRGKCIKRDDKGRPLRIIGTHTDITELRRAEEALKQYASKLEWSNRELGEFAYIASHDLQEPLRKVKAFGDRLKSKYCEVLDDQGCDYIERMQNAVSRMQTLISDLLSYSRVTTKAQPFVPVDLIQVAKDVVFDLEMRIQQVGGRVEIGDLPTIDADPTQMRQLLQNLIGNALKFRREDEPPLIKVYSTLPNVQEEPQTEDVSDQASLSNDPQCQIIVEDNGIGFDEKYLDQIFRVFQRLHTRSQYEGSGIGLGICRKIVQRHRGSITARSKPGEGTAFIATLPMKQPTEENE